MEINMKYNDYPLPTEQLTKVLSYEYAKQGSGIATLSYSEQNASLSDLYYNIELCGCYLEKLKLFGAKGAKEAIETTLSNLNLLASIGIKPAIKAEFNKKLNQKTCFFEYLKCEMDVLKALMFLLFLDNPSFSKKELIKIANDRINIVILGLN